MRRKIFIIYHNEDIIKKLVNYINENSDINISKKFITDINSVKQNNLNNYYELSSQETNIAIKNNSLLYVITQNYISSGITYDNFYNNDLFILTYKEYNAIPNMIFNKYDILTIWVDSKLDSNIDKDEIFKEIIFIEKRFETVNNEYFMNDPIEEIFYCINNFLTPDVKNEENE